MKKYLYLFSAVVLIVGTVVVYRAATYDPLEPPAATATRVDFSVDVQAVGRRLGESVRFQTISQQPPAVTDPTPFEDFIAWLETTYPEAHRALKRERIGGYSLLFTWTGKDPAAKPVLLTAHYDVVPVLPGTEAQWKHAPFSGVIADGHVWGRGTLDDKGAVICMMEAVTHLLAQGYQPPQTVYLSFGHDEEIGGEQGAGAVTAHLKAQGVRLAWSLDEGSFVLDGILPTAKPAASINVSEKGYLTLDLIARGAGGHSSMPPRETAVGILAEAIVKLQRAPLPGGLEGLTAESFDTIARHMSFDKKLLFANQWLFGGLIDATLSNSPGTNATMRTTTAPTMLSGSVKENILPIEAVGTVNFRLHPRDTPDSVIAYVKKTVNDPRVEIKPRGRAVGASPVASSKGPAFAAMAGAVRQVYGDVIVAPGLTIAGTDSKHYETIADNAYRFNPMLVRAEDLTGFHGTNERISLENLARAVRFYVTLLKNYGA
jgi:carboxypeptidase PM20D1